MLSNDDVNERVRRACEMSGTPPEEAEKLASDFTHALARITPVEVRCPVCFEASCTAQHRDQL